MLIGNFMLLNLFLAILLKHLQDAVIEEEKEKLLRLQEKKAEKENKEYNDKKTRPGILGAIKDQNEEKVKVGSKWVKKKK